MKSNTYTDKIGRVLQEYELSKELTVDDVRELVKNANELYEQISQEARATGKDNSVPSNKYQELQKELSVIQTKLKGYLYYKSVLEIPLGLYSEILNAAYSKFVILRITHPAVELFDRDLTKCFDSKLVNKVANHIAEHYPHLNNNVKELK